MWFGVSPDRTVRRNMLFFFSFFFFFWTSEPLSQRRNVSSDKQHRHCECYNISRKETKRLLGGVFLEKTPHCFFCVFRGSGCQPFYPLNQFFFSFNSARLMLPRCFSISRIIDKSSQETYGSGFLASCCGCHVVLVILPRLSKLADEVVGFLG